MIKKRLIKTKNFKIDMIESEFYIYYLYLSERLKSDEELKIYEDTFNNFFYEMIRDENIQASFLMLPLAHFLTFEELGLISYLIEEEKERYFKIKEDEEFKNEERKKESH